MIAHERRAAITIAVSLASLPFIVPHAVEDFSLGIAQRVGLSPGVGGFLLGAYLAIQSLGLVLLARGRRAGWIVSFWIALIWSVGALADHGPDIARPGAHFREGTTSVLWVLGLIATQATVAVLAGAGWRRARRT